ncbi:hypothetical protein DQ04_01401130 [Trypanosoma grayi]|uniref:hypothetical protein n=1 Tax=Trypanosoma grayi TaxID=71804 RepID=UPI0004F44F53|nr:hypothetical protein DQ04_01401130 [Trypanosoma grayi]KEG12829.1 hypothetical protein DQ04_01401130 [Trypanosoma grayi]
MTIVVQLVIASTGFRVSLVVKQAKSPSLLASSSLASSSQGNVVTTTKIFVSDVVLGVQSRGSSPQGVSGTEGSKQSYVEVFDYATLRPLLANEAVTDGQKLLLFTPPVLSDTLMEHLASLGPPTHDTPCMSTTEEERWQNLRQAILALRTPLKLHQDVMERELEVCNKQFETTKAEFAMAEKGIYEAMENIKNVKIFYSLETPATEFVDAKYMEAVIQQGGVKLQEAEECLTNARNMAPGIIEAIRSEAQVAEGLEGTSAWKTFSASTTEGSNETAVSVLMKEVERKVQVVRLLVSKITLATKRLQKCRHYCQAVVYHVVQQHKKLCRLPEGLEAAQGVVKRRIILRRAIRRLLVPLEALHSETEEIIHQFAEKWSQWLPDGLFRAVSSPLPPLYPLDDALAQGEDHLFVDIEDDETEGLLATIGSVSSAEVANIRAMEREMEKNMELVKALQEENAKLKDALRQQQAAL